MKSILVIFVSIAILSAIIYVTFSSHEVDDFIEHDENADRTRKFKVNQHLVTLGDQADHLLWFVQISDIHISIFHDEERIHEFRVFASETVDTIKPKVVLASGDLTDAKDRDLLGSRQYEDEWKIYNEILNQTNVRNKTLWMDIRGNHDNFNVPGHMTRNNYFQKYSIQGSEHKRSYMKLVKGGSGELYTFIAVDACLEPGPKRPFNFIGLLTQNDTDHIHRLIDRSRNAGSNYTVWFAHYPTSCIMTMNNQSQSLREIISDADDGLVYMCGHLHTLGGMVPNMYTLQRNRFLELELADFKSSRIYRVAAIDHGVFSFVDVRHNTWPVILITNPKHALYHIPHRDEAKLQLESTHIRLLAFSPAGIANCTVTIDDNFVKHCDKITENLFVVKWDPKRYQNGLHTITAILVDRYGQQNKATQPFKLDEKKDLTFDVLARFILMTDISTVFKFLFIFALTLCVAPLIFFRIWHRLVVAGYLSRKRSTCRTSMSIIQKLWILSTVDRLFWPIIGYCIYLAVGPWSFCEIIDGHYGVIFVWGIYIDGSYLPGSLTYLYGYFQLMLCQLPLIWIYSKCTEKAYYEVIGMPTKKHRGTLHKLSQAPFYIIIAIEILLAIFFGMAYGAVAFIIGPFRSWSVVLNLILFYLARNLPDECLKSAVFVWSTSEKSKNIGPFEPPSEM